MLKRRQDQQGVTLVEFALITPIVVLILLGIFDFGRAIYQYNTLSHLAREGARFAIVLNHRDGDTDPNDEWGREGNLPKTYTGTDAVESDTVVAAIVTKAASFDRSKLRITITASDEHPREWPVAVAVEYPYEPLTTFIVGGVTVNMRASSEMVIE